MSASEIPLPPLTPQQEEAIAANYLVRLAEQKLDLLPPPIYVPVAKLVVMHTVEVGFVKPLHEDEAGMLVLLTRRPATDKFWPSKWHIPGSIVRPNDPITHEHDYDAAFSRVMDEVGGDMRVIKEPLELRPVRRKGPRGSEVTVRFLAEVEGEPANGTFFDVARILRKPPEGGLIDTHGSAIEKVAAAYSASRTLTS